MSNLSYCTPINNRQVPKDISRSQSSFNKLEESPKKSLFSFGSRNLLSDTCESQTHDKQLE